MLDYSEHVGRVFMYAANGLLGIGWSESTGKAVKADHGDAFLLVEIDKSKNYCHHIFMDKNSDLVFVTNARLHHLKLVE